MQLKLGEVTPISVGRWLGTYRSTVAVATPAV